jgi:glutathione S-transferase
LTPNGNKVQILLEELKDVYGLEWTTSLIDIDTDEQKKPWFLKLNPNGRIPQSAGWYDVLHLHRENPRAH